MPLQTKESPLELMVKDGTMPILKPGRYDYVRHDIKDIKRPKLGASIFPISYLCAWSICKVKYYNDRGQDQYHFLFSYLLSIWIIFFKQRIPKSVLNKPISIQ